MNDPRRQALTDWCADVLGDGGFRLTPASEDASFRRYFRVHSGAGTRIVMDAPPEHEPLDRFLQVADLLREAGVHAPRVYAADRSRGFLLLEDLGTRSYLDVLDADNADRMFADATGALVRWQSASRPGVLPLYDRGLLHEELMLFPEWYLERHLGRRLAKADSEHLEALFGQLEDCALAQPRVFVHRDFMPRNLMVSDPNPGVIDFQDAVYGPVTYDALSLFRDAFVSWPAERVLSWLRRYWESARLAGVPVHDDFDVFVHDWEWMGVQRHLKVIGIFARLCHRDGKPQYLEDVPRFFGYLRETLPRHEALRPLLELLDEAARAPGRERTR